MNARHEQLVAALAAESGNVARAARRIGMHRPNVYRMLARAGVTLASLGYVNRSAGRPRRARA